MTKADHIRTVKYFLGISLGGGLLFSGSSVLCRCVSLKTSLIIGLLGFFIGAMALPEMEKGIIKNEVMYQVLIGVLLCITAAFIFNASTEWYFIAVLLGALIGYLSPFWLKYVQLPC